MKRTVLLMFLVLTLNISFDQERRRWNFEPDLFPIDGWRGIYMGPNISYELSTLGIGGELKYFDSFYGTFLSLSVYSNYRYLFDFNEIEHPNNCVGIGGHYAIFGLETNLYFGNHQLIWGLMPKIGIDKGAFSLFYGYDFKLFNQSNFDKGIHNITFKYSMLWFDGV